MPQPPGEWSPFHEWGFWEWTLTTSIASGSAVAGFLFRLYNRVNMMERDIKSIERETEKRHADNASSHRELVGELKNIRQTLESSHRDLTRRIDNFVMRQFKDESGST